MKNFILWGFPPTCALFLICGFSYQSAKEIGELKKEVKTLRAEIAKVDELTIKAINVGNENDFKLQETLLLTRRMYEASSKTLASSTQAEKDIVALIKFNEMDFAKINQSINEQGLILSTIEANTRRQPPQAPKPALGPRIKLLQP